MNRFLLLLGNQRVLYLYLFFALAMLLPVAHAQGEGTVSRLMYSHSGNHPAINR